jgi:hypothetical protein
MVCTFVYSILFYSKENDHARSETQLRSPHLDLKPGLKSITNNDWERGIRAPEAIAFSYMTVFKSYTGFFGNMFMRRDRGQAARYKSIY